MFEFRAIGALPRRHFRALVVDPPWQFATWSARGRGRSAENHYATLSDIELEALPIAELALPDAVLFLWSSGPVLERSLRLLAAWGFGYRTIGFVWVKKPGLGLGYWTRAQSELVLLAVRGKPKRVAFDVPQVVQAPRLAHSAKPEAVQDGIERLVDGPYLELFARRQRPCWTCWGDEL